MCAAGILLVMLSGLGASNSVADSREWIDASFDVTEIEKTAESIFSQIEGVGKVDVKITVKSGYEAVYAYDTSHDCTQSDNGISASQEKEIVTVSANGHNKPVTIKIKNAGTDEAVGFSIAGTEQVEIDDMEQDGNTTIEDGEIVTPSVTPTN